MVVCDFASMTPFPEDGHLRTTLPTSLLVVMTTTLPGFADPIRFEAELAGHAILPAETSIPAPADAPAALQVSGKFAITEEPVRTDRTPTEGDALPLAGQPVQGFSGIRQIEPGRYYVLTDNGFGAAWNSPDAMLAFHVLRPDFETGEVLRERTVFLRDPDAVVPFVLTMEGSETRYLTGADFDLEGFQVLGGKIFLGDEFGPYMLVADAATGVVEGVHETVVGDLRVMSPDHYAIQVQSSPESSPPAFNLARSRGYEGFAAAPDGSILYPLLEGPIWDPEAGAYESIDGQTALRILEFDVANRAWTGRSWFYLTEAPGHAIGDFNMIDATRGLVIERDSGQGDAERACRSGETEDCFEQPARFKRVYLIDFAGVEPGRPVHKVGYVDLLDIQDPNRLARVGQRADGRFTFPFVTIENVDRVDEAHIIVANDNNFPFSRGRTPERPDNNEFILLEVADFLNARAD